MDVWIEDAYGQPRCFAAFTSSNVVGEIAFIEGGTRSARVVAGEDSRLWRLKRERLSDIEKLDTRIVHLLIADITREIAARLRSTTEDLRRR